MSSQQVFLGGVAVGFGLVAGLVLLVPFVAVAYRRVGRVTAGMAMLWSSALLYFVALWVYTLLPMPDPGSIVCTTPQLNVMAFVDDLAGALQRGHLLSDSAFLQLALNVLLFVPLGFLVRLIWRRGIVVATLVGAGLSLMIEVTQVTGVWGLYPCAYRLFDVDDLLTNTLGAVIGSLLSLLLPARLRVRRERISAALEPQPVTRGRRLLAGLADLLSVALTSLAVGVGIFVSAAVIVGDHVLDPQAPWIAWTTMLAPFVLTTSFFAVTGRTIGQAAVQLRYAASPYPRGVALSLVYLGGIGGYQLLAMIPAPWGPWPANVFALVWLAMALATRRGRGLPGLLSKSELVDSRAVDGPPLNEGPAAAADARAADSAS